LTYRSARWLLLAQSIGHIHRSRVHRSEFMVPQDRHRRQATEKRKAHCPDFVLHDRMESVRSRRRSSASLLGNNVRVAVN